MYITLCHFSALHRWRGCIWKKYHFHWSHCLDPPRTVGLARVGTHMRMSEFSEGFIYRPGIPSWWSVLMVHIKIWDQFFATLHWHTKRLDRPDRLHHAWLIFLCFFFCIVVLSKMTAKWTWSKSTLAVSNSSECMGGTDLHSHTAVQMWPNRNWDQPKDRKQIHKLKVRWKLLRCDVRSSGLVSFYKCYCYSDMIFLAKKKKVPSKNRKRWAKLIHAPRASLPCALLNRHVIAHSEVDLPENSRA